MYHQVSHDIYIYAIRYVMVYTIIYTVGCGKKIDIHCSITYLLYTPWYTNASLAQ
jgi:hypothetical protein